MNPFNQLPTDPAWAKALDDLCKTAHLEMKCDVVMIAAQEDGKLGVSVEGDGTVAGMFKVDPPRALTMLAMVIAGSMGFDQLEPRQ